MAIRHVAWLTGMAGWHGWLAWLAGMAPAAAASPFSVVARDSGEMKEGAQR
jgi:hypothetical protein